MMHTLERYHEASFTLFDDSRVDIQDVEKQMLQVPMEESFRDSTLWLLRNSFVSSFTLNARTWLPFEQTWWRYAYANTSDLSAESWRQGWIDSV